MLHECQIVFYNKTTDNFTLSKKGFMFFLCVYFVEAPFVQYKQTHALLFAIIYGLTNPRKHETHFIKSYLDYE